MTELNINTEKKHVTLEQVITEGTDALVPYEFKYPNTDLIVEVKVRPVTSKEMNDITQLTKINPDTTVDLELLKIALYNVDDTPFTDEILYNLPIGVVFDLVYKIGDISGMDMRNIVKKEPSSDSLAGF